MSSFLQSGDLPYLQRLSGILGRKLTFVDLETTGLVHEHDFAIIEIGLISIFPDRFEEKSALINPGMRIPRHITNITGITDDMVRGKKSFKDFTAFFKKVAYQDVLMGFNSRSFDSKGLERMGKYHGTPYVFSNQIDVRHWFLKQRNHLLGQSSQKGSLIEACQFFKINLSGNAHRAAYDIAITALLAEKLLQTHSFSSPFLLNEIQKMNCLLSKGRFQDYLGKNKY